jgi:tRNA threonylcarbamoyl adenosine modification protein (Sua5/YciO/YrdC/YwlC family)
VAERYDPGLFDGVLGALPGVPVKPDPAMLKILMDRIGAVPEATLFVGDSNVDIQTGKNGGLTTCGVLWGFRSREELAGEGADFLIGSPAELVKLVTGTEVLTPADHASAAQLLAEDRLVAVPPETVYGLAADAFSEKAVHANYEAKGRPDTKPLNVLVDGMAMVESVCKDIPLDAYKLAEAFWPGPLTMILQGKGTLPTIVPAGGATQGVRCPDHPDTLAVIRALGRPLACPSANLSGHPSPKSAGDVLAQLGGRIDAVLDGGPCSVGVESTILDLTVTPYRILRQGGLSKADIEAVLGREVAG